MTHVEIEERIEAPADDVWDCYVGSRGEELARGIYAESATTEGEGVGAVRTSVLLDGAGTIRERIVEFDTENYVCRYLVIERGPLPFADHQGLIQITPLGASACLLKLTADFTPDGMSEQESIDLYLQNNHGGIDKLKTMLGVG